MDDSKRLRDLIRAFFGVEGEKDMGQRFLFRLTAIAVAIALVVLGAGVAWADDLVNTIDTTVDPQKETLALQVGGGSKLVTVKVIAADESGSGSEVGCNIDSNENLIVDVTSANTAIATVSPAQLTFTACEQERQITVSPVAAGSADIDFNVNSLTNTGGRYTTNSARFTAVVAAANDTTPPVITKSITGNAGLNGWYTSNVSVAWTVTDAESAVTIVSGCGTQSFTSETAAATSSCSAQSTGGNSSDAIGLKIDKTGPSATLSATGTEGTNSWYTSNVSVDTSGTDGISGGVVCTATQSFTANTTGTTVNGSCTNAAGLTTNATALNLKIDKTAPTVTLTKTPDATWSNVAVSVTPTPADAGGSEVDLSTLACINGSIPLTLDEGSVTISAEGIHSITCSVRDYAGNLGTSTALAVSIDQTDPEVSLAELDSPTNDDTPAVSGTAEPGSGDVTISIWNGTDTSGDADDSFDLAIDENGDFTGNAPTLAEGTYSLQASQTDVAGNTGTSVVRSVTIDTTPPEVELNPISGPTKDRTPTLSGTAEPGSGDVTISIWNGTDTSGDPDDSFTLAVDDEGNFSGDVPTDKELGADGTVSFKAAQTDAAGNTGFSYVQQVAIDNTPPTASILTGPATLTNSDSASFTYTSDELGSTFECQFDDGGWDACVTVEAGLVNLGDGEHTFQVRATDAAGNTGTGEDIASHTWTIDTVAPTTTIDGGPTGTTMLRTATFAFSSTDLTATFECKLDSGAWTDCDEGSAEYTDLSAGVHTFYVKATDEAGNTESPAVSRSWTVVTYTSTFKAPIDGGGTINVAKLGRVVPVKAEVLGSNSTELKTGVVSAHWAKIACDSTAPVDSLETYAAGSSNTGNQFRWDPSSDMWQYNLDTSSLGQGTANTCFRIELRAGGTPDANGNVSFRDSTKVGQFLIKLTK